METICVAKKLEIEGRFSNAQMTIYLRRHWKKSYLPYHRPTPLNWENLLLIYLCFVCLDCKIFLIGLSQWNFTLVPCMFGDTDCVLKCHNCLTNCTTFHQWHVCISCLFAVQGTGTPGVHLSLFCVVRVAQSLISVYCFVNDCLSFSPQSWPSWSWSYLVFGLTTDAVSIYSN